MGPRLSVTGRNGRAGSSADDAGRILLQRRRDNDMWALPGGAMHIGESLPDCAIRETREETGFDVETVGIVGTYTNPHHVFAYDDGEVRQAPRSRRAPDGLRHPKARERLVRRQHARCPLGVRRDTTVLRGRLRSHSCPQPGPG
ncbi:NUDIX domain-containing protein [Streptomyces lasalocidi]